MNRQEAREQFGHAMFLIGSVPIIAEDANDKGDEVQFSVWIRKEDVEKFLGNLSRPPQQASLDLYGTSASNLDWRRSP
jgi:hypothetical protein